MIPDFDSFKKGILSFFESRKVTGEFNGYSFTPGLTPTYWASSYPAIVYSLIGIIDELPEDLRKKWALFLRQGQDPETGFYKEPIDDNNKPTGPVHKAEDVLWHGATFINGALHVLGEKPEHGFRVLDDYKSEEGMVRWLERLPWYSPWKSGNYTYDMGCLMGTDYEITGNAKNLEAMKVFFDWMDTNIDRSTGWWNISGEAPLFSQQFGGYHTLIIYWMFDREVPDPEKMIESSLSLQSDDGSYSGYGCCGDMDVVDTIVTLSRQYDICREKVRQSLERFYPYLMDKLAYDGGFISLHGSSHIDLQWKLHAGKTGESDPCSTYFRTYTLSLLNEILELPWLLGVEWKHMDGCCHGFRPSGLSEKKDTK